MSLLIKNAIIINADKSDKDTKEILIEKGVIKKIAPKVKADGAKVIDAAGKYVLPGFVDLHAHLREPGREDKETIESGSRSAVKGGFTTILCMPNTNPVIDNCMIVEAVIKEARRVGLLNVIPVGAITKGQNDQELSDIFELKKAGCLALSDDGKTVANAKLMRLAVEYAKMANVLLIEHCQDPCLAQGGVMNEGRMSTLLGMKADPGLSETVMVARDIEIAKYLDGRIHIAHVSLKRTVELVRMAKKQGVQITAEVTPHHFSLTEDALAGFNTSTKVNPPLRTEEDVREIKQALKEGVIDCIATDHAPHTQEDKEVDFDHAPFGMIGFETAFALAVTELVDTKVLTWPKLVQRMSKTPADLIGLEAKGVVSEGADADIVIVDPQESWEVKKEDIVSKSKNSPFLSRTLMGRVKVTIYNGKEVYRDKGFDG